MMKGIGLASQGTETAKVKVGRWEGCGCLGKGDPFGLAME